MSTSITTAFVAKYESEVHHIYQREGSLLMPSVRHKSGVIGLTDTFQKIGTGTATTKSRHGTITPMNQTHEAPTVTLVDFYAGDWVDKLDEAKITHDERQAIAKGGAMALGRKVDEQILTALDSTTQSTITLTVTSKATVLATLIEFVEALDDNDVPNDGMRYGLLTPRMWSQAMSVEEFASSDYVQGDGLPFTQGAPVMQRWKAWNGVLWKVHTGLPGKGTATAKCFIYHKNAIGYASAASAGNVAGNGAVSADIQWHNDRASHFIMHHMSGGALLIDDTGVIEGNLNDTTAIVTS